MRPLDLIIRDITKKYLDGIDVANIPKPETVSEQLLDLFRVQCASENAVRDKADKVCAPTSLPAAVLAEVMMRINYVKLVSLSPNKHRESFILVGYNDDGENAGLYTEDRVFQIAKSYDYMLNNKKFKEVCLHLQQELPLTIVSNFNAEKAIVHNGIFNFATKQLEPFTPNYVYLTKPKTDYNPTAKNVFIPNPDGTVWDFDSWLTSISINGEVEELLWHVINSAIRHTTRDCVVFFYAQNGCNGKGTLLTALRNILGEENCASIPLSEWGQRFRTYQLLDSCANLVDENPVKDYAKLISDLKAVATADVISAEKKNGAHYCLRYHGIQIFCINSLVRLGDDSGSLYRRLLIIPFDKTFVGKENKLIKRDYLKRQDVLEYALKRALELGNPTSYEEPDICKAMKDEYKLANDAIRDFLAEMLPQFSLDLIPQALLFDVYKCWYRDNCTGVSVGSRKFYERVRQIIAEDYADKWRYTDKNRCCHSKGKMEMPEPLIARYDLRNWFNTLYHGNDIDKICLIPLKATYEGLVRL